eukprot:6191932-Pleurochrysis_carterae.AAC.4
MGQSEITQTRAAGMRFYFSKSRVSASSLANASSAAASAVGTPHCSYSLRSSEPRFSPGSYHTLVQNLADDSLPRMPISPPQSTRSQCISASRACAYGLGQYITN